MYLFKNLKNKIRVLRLQFKKKIIKLNESKIEILIGRLIIIINKCLNYGETRKWGRSKHLKIKSSNIKYISS